MKKIKILSSVLLLVLGANLAFGQMKIQPKAVVVFLGPKNQTFNETDFPDIQFYYTPNLALKVSEKASKNTNKKAWSSALGVGRTAGAEANDSYTGSPQALIDNGVKSGFSTLLDPNGVINGKTFNAEKEYFTKSMGFMVKFNNLQRKWEYETFGDLMKTIQKKGTAYDPPKKKKKKEKDTGKYEVGEKFDDFIVHDKDGNEININSLFEAEKATLVTFLRLNPTYDLNEGKESGEGKKGKDYMNQVAQSVAAEKQMEPLFNIEKGIFGKRLK